MKEVQLEKKKKKNREEKVSRDIKGTEEKNGVS